jgi:hypothetical protein
LNYYCDQGLVDYEGDSDEEEEEEELDEEESGTPADLLSTPPAKRARLS